MSVVIYRYVKSENSLIKNEKLYEKSLSLNSKSHRITTFNTVKVVRMHFLSFLYTVGLQKTWHCSESMLGML